MFYFHFCDVLYYHVLMHQICTETVPVARIVPYAVAILQFVVLRVCQESIIDFLGRVASFEWCSCGVICSNFEGKKEKRMKKRLYGVVLCALVLLSGSCLSFAADYDHETEAGPMTFAWKVTESDLFIKISGKTTGWVGIGFNPEDQMKGANYIIGYVKGDEVELRNDYGDTERSHKADEELGGTSDVTVIGGEEKGGITTLEFSIPLDSGDKFDTVIDPQGETVIHLAFGGKRDSFISKHQFRTTLTVNLSNGTVQ
jgi:hypothetical protein